jgi:hypothetical protein
MEDERDSDSRQSVPDELKGQRDLTSFILLDHTVIVYLSDSGDAHDASLFEWPGALLGNRGGKLRTVGRYFQFPCYQAKDHRTMANLYLTLLQAAGKPRDKFGVADPALRYGNRFRNGLRWLGLRNKGRLEVVGRARKATRCVRQRGRLRLNNCFQR